MSQTTLRRAWSRVWTLFVAATAFYFLSNNEADNDLWVHLRIGLDILASGSVPRADPYSYTAAAATWIDHEWLLHWLFAVAYVAAGSPGLLILKLFAAGVTTGALGSLVCRKTGSAHVRAVVLLLVLVVASRGFAIRPQIVTYMAVALLLAGIESRPRHGWGSALLLFATLVVWGNVHGGFLAGIAIVGLYAAWRLPADPRTAVALGSGAAASIALTFLFSPYGWSLAGYLWRELNAAHPITEWQPVSFERSQATFFLLAAAFVATLPLTRDWRRSGWQVALGLLLLAAALKHQRHTPLFALCVAPALAANLDEARRRLPRWRLSDSAQVVLVAAIGVLAAFQIIAAGSRLGRSRFRVVFDPLEYPVGAVRALRAGAFEGNLAVPLDWGAYVLWHAAPRIKVSLDARFATLYPPSVVETNFALFSGAAGWRSLIDDHPTDLVLAPSATPVRVESLPGWRVAYRDRVATLLVREGARAGRAPHPELPAPWLPAKLYFP